MAANAVSFKIDHGFVNPETRTLFGPPYSVAEQSLSGERDGRVLTLPQPRMHERGSHVTKLSEKHLAFMFGVVFVIVLLTLATLVPNPTPFQYTVFRIVLALAAGGVAAMIPGFLTVNVPNILRAGGALAVFVVVYFYSPAALTGVKVKTEQEVELEKPILHLKEGTRHFPPLVLVATAFAQESSR